MPSECSLSLSSILVRARCNHRATAATDNPAAFTELPRVTMLENEERIRVLFANPPGLLAATSPGILRRDTFARDQPPFTVASFLYFRPAITIVHLEIFPVGGKNKKIQPTKGKVYGIFSVNLNLEVNRERIFSRTWPCFTLCTVGRRTIAV